jgi:hypothetical protein
VTTPFDPSSHPSDPTPTEPVPAFAPPPSGPAAASQSPSAPAYGAPPALGAPPAYASAPPAFAPVDPSATGASLAPAPVTVQKPRGTSGSGRVLNVALGVAVLVAVAGVSFALGRTTAPVPASSQTALGGGGGRFFNGGGPNASFAPGAGGPGFAGRGGAFGGAGVTLSGTVDSVSPTSLTLKTTAGATITIGLDSNTTYHQQAPAQASDVTTGKTVRVQVTGGGFRGNGNGNNGNGNGNGGANGGANGDGSFTLGSASDVTIVP